jgi:hypothetical protein
MTLRREGTGTFGRSFLAWRSRLTPMHSVCQCRGLIIKFSKITRNLATRLYGVCVHSLSAKSEVGKRQAANCYRQQRSDLAGAWRTVNDVRGLNRAAKIGKRQPSVCYRREEISTEGGC